MNARVRGGILAGAALALFATLLAGPPLGGWKWLQLAAAVAVVAVLISPRRRAAPIASPAARDGDETATVEQLREALRGETERLEQRERQLARRLAAYHQWMEFPEPVAFNAAAPAPWDAQPSGLAPTAAELAGKDRELMRMLDQETERLFDRIRDNVYSPDGDRTGAVLVERLRSDAARLALRVAQLYQPTAQAPLLETSVSMILRSTGRAALQLQVVLDELPLDVKDRSISSLYNYVRQAVRAYGVYKAARPYLPAVTNAYYFGRYAFGTSPLALGAWYAATTVGKRSAQALATRVVNRHALRLLQSLVRLIGFEVAQIYGGDFRRRDPNWIFAAELTELLKELPVGRDSLAIALREIGQLELRSEYDRVFLYRCLAERRSAEPERWEAAEVLPPQERLAVAQRLERVVSQLIENVEDQAIRQWRGRAEQRLRVKLTGAAHADGADGAADALRSLAGYLIEVKHLEPAEIGPWLAATNVHPRLTEAQQAAAIAEPSCFFEYADLTPGSELASDYLDDLARLAAAIPPRTDQASLLMEVAGYLHEPAEAMQKRCDQAALAALASRMPKDGRRGAIDAGAARQLLDLCEPLPIACLFPAAIECQGKRRSGWLVGVERRLLLWSESSGLEWEGAAEELQFETRRTWNGLVGAFQGGRWTDPDSTASFHLPTTLLTRQAQYFAPLLNLLRGGNG